MGSKVNKREFGLSVVIPAYNAAHWLPKMIPKLEKAIRRAELEQVEIIIVDDGSTDSSYEVAKNINSQYKVKVIRQKNSGRFLARKLGAEKAKYFFVLYIDTRIFINETSLAFVFEKITKNPKLKVWTSHVYLYKKGNIYARFWDAIASIAWRKYFSNPKYVAYGVEEFDYYPKGTTCFIAPAEVIVEANEWFKSNTKDLKNSNDDTLLIRHIAEKNKINLSPAFSCVYHARPKLGQFTKHTMHRGSVFVDGFLRNDGNRFFWPLILFLTGSIIVPAVLILKPIFVVPFILLSVVMWLLELIIALVLLRSFKDSASLFMLTPMFVAAYGFGIWKAVFKIYVLKRVTRRGLGE